MGTTQSVDGLYRTKLFHAIYDATAGANGSWQEIALLLSGGGLHAQRVVSRAHYDIEAAKKSALEFAGMQEYIGVT
jgi:4-hydroxybutyryl-CoA dehydratase/vinylacetyl-CoA-Delta-isomerase